MKEKKKAHGQLRMGQVISTYGPGAMLDLPKYSVIVSGLDWWTKGRQIAEERLCSRIERMLDRRGLKLLEPPLDSDDPSKAPRGIRVWEFPQWFVAQEDQVGKGGVRSRRLVHVSDLNDRHQYVERDFKSSVVPVRFVRACPNGHIDDLDWYDFVHQKDKGCRRPLWLDESGTSGDIADLTVRCECREERSLMEATIFNLKPLGFCRGERPWLGRGAAEKCGGEQGKAAINRLLVRTASNAYFPQVVSAISIPDRSAKVANAVTEVWDDFLSFVESGADLQRDRKRPSVAQALAGLSDAEVMAEIDRRKKGGGGEKALKDAEIEALLSCEEESGDDKPRGEEFHARRLRLVQATPLMELVDRVVLVHRLREVRALIGFTRFESVSTEVDGELEIGVRRASLSKEQNWFPAVENRGEGIFLGFSASRMKEWMARRSVDGRTGELIEGFNEWKRVYSAEAEFPTSAYIMLHSLSHLLITAVALECGYSTTSIRERIYVGPSGYGILLYTASSDADGTLGGLVQVGRKIDHHLRDALERGLLCSNDPVCSQHRPMDAYEERFLHGAACHGCLLIAETSCERWNQHLDRSLVVPTVQGLGAEFFPESVI